MSVMVCLSTSSTVCKNTALARRLAYTELELSSAEKWGDDSGVCSVMPASGIEMLCWLRAVARATTFDSFLVSRRVPAFLSSCLSQSLLLSVSISSPVICISASSCCLYSYVCFVAMSVGYFFPSTFSSGSTVRAPPACSCTCAAFTDGCLSV